MRASIEAPYVDARRGGGAGEGKIGPNAVTRVAEALLEMHGTPVCRDVFAAAGLERHLDRAPTQMVDESDAARLHSALVEVLGFEPATRVAQRAGALTGDYLLFHRIPQAAQRLLRRLPRRLAAALLLRAIAKHAWTFAGSGAFSYGFNPALSLRLRGAPICRLVRSDTPACGYYAATFQRVFAAMLGPSTRVVETQCEAQGSSECVFEVSW
ncbi:MAG: bacteriochlorophyll 4-vinyl reductase [Methylocystis sp.]